MKKKELYRVLAKKTDMYIYQIEEVMSAFQDTLVDVMKSGDKLYLHGFGTFKPVEIGERMVKSQFTDEPIYIPPYTRVSFKASDQLFREINGRDRGMVQPESEEE